MGSKISLMSKAQIRYEGVLHSVNRDDSTITLSQGEQWHAQLFNDIISHVQYNLLAPKIDRQRSTWRRAMTSSSSLSSKYVLTVVLN